MDPNCFFVLVPSCMCWVPSAPARLLHVVRTGVHGHMVLGDSQLQTFHLAGIMRVLQKLPFLSFFFVAKIWKHLNAWRGTPSVGKTTWWVPLLQFSKLILLQCGHHQPLHNRGLVKGVTDTAPPQQTNPMGRVETPHLVRTIRHVIFHPQRTTCQQLWVTPFILPWVWSRRFLCNVLVGIFWNHFWSTRGRLPQ